MIAHATQDLDDCREEANVVHRLGQLDTAKVTWAVLAAAPTGTAGGTTTVHCAHLKVAETSNLWLSLLICLGILNCHNRVAPLHVTGSLAQVQKDVSRFSKAHNPPGVPQSLG